MPDDLAEARMIDVITGPDERWARPNIKTIALLPNILSKQMASEAGAYETWLMNEVTMGFRRCVMAVTSMNALYSARFT